MQVYADECALVRNKRTRAREMSSEHKTVTNKITCLNINPNGKVVNDKSNKDDRCLDNHSDLTDRSTIKILFINVNFLWKKLDFPWLSWRSGYCHLNKGECDLNQSKDDSLVKRVAKNHSRNNGDCHKIHEIFLINCFVFVIILVWKTVHSSVVTQITANLMEKTLKLIVPE